jgi:hypothetical protein
MAESIPRNQFLGSINVYKYGLREEHERWLLHEEPSLILPHRDVKQISTKTFIVKLLSYDDLMSDFLKYVGHCPEHKNTLNIMITYFTRIIVHCPKHRQCHLCHGEEQ